MVQLLLAMSRIFHCFGAQVPANFRGSPEIFSRYLPESDKFIESFTYHNGLVIEGSSKQVELMLANSIPKGKPKQYAHNKI